MSAPQNNAQHHPRRRGAPSLSGRRWLGGLAATALAGTWMLAGSAPAHAATAVSIFDGSLRVQAAAGKANNLTIGSVRSGTDRMIVVVKDSGDRLIAGEGCTTYSDGSVRCNVLATENVVVLTEDQDDVVTMSGYMVGGSTQVHGGEGNDKLTGTGKTDYLHGEEGDDVLQGGGGLDILHGGVGKDALYGQDGNDDLWGNPGNDSLDGGPGVDYLAGQQGDDYLYGDAGDDTLHGYEGSDTVAGGPGKDKAFGDAGDDFVTVYDDVPYNDSADGGEGTDRCAGDTGDKMSACETVSDR